jgi:uncharacterized protein YdeI (YjbR/CyaY-like superfamily)
MKRYTTVEDYLNGQEQWQDELRLVRDILASTELDETVKWGAPAYTYKGKILAGIGGFKSYFGLWFHQGALLEDKAKKLINAQEGVTKALRQWRFDSIEEVDADLIKAYITESVENLNAGKTIKPAKKKPLIIPEELTQAFKTNAGLKECFDQFTLSKQREFTEHIGEAKREETRIKRLEKSIPMIMKGTGLHDKYR